MRKPGAYLVLSVDKQHFASLIIAPNTNAADKLTVSTQMNQMRHNTERIDADQTEINAAHFRFRCRIFPIRISCLPQGRMTTPFSCQRVVTGKPQIVCGQAQTRPNNRPHGEHRFFHRSPSICTAAC
jgi:hypothetical protein